MRIIPFVTVTLLVAFSASAPAAIEASEVQRMEREAAAFFDTYIAVYNQRFGHPERSEQFHENLSAVVRMPLLQSPPVGAPRVPDSMEGFTQNFEGFVKMLEGKGVTRLQWRSKEFHVLSANKVLANNTGVGLGENGEVVYETASLYLAYRGEEGWRIVLFSPYDKDHPLSLSDEISSAR